MMDGEGVSYARFEGSTLVEVEKVEEEWYVGEVKSFAPVQGYGFIQCEDTFARFNSDVFLHKRQVEEGPLKRVQKGDKVRFSVEMNKAGRPQARNVERYNDGAWVSPEKSFLGRVKGFREDLGYGFIACEDTRNIFNSDIFLHRNQYESAGLVQGAMATFTVEVNDKGKPQARNVARFVPESFTEDGRPYMGQASDAPAPGPPASE